MTKCGLYYYVSKRTCGDTAVMFLQNIDRHSVFSRCENHVPLSMTNFKEITEKEYFEHFAQDILES